ncbi:MAG: single-stranded-DNA-specific exonuclease RecJ [Candidatus Poribacteria bacterium]|nr:single-stranded-DNA-specific exonuclease RecJ [Candidatus Poribacteria bacterium]
MPSEVHSLSRRMTKWQLKRHDSLAADQLAIETGVSAILAKALVGRGVATAEAVKTYLHPTYEDLHSPFLLNDMEKAVERVGAAIRNGERIWVYGDYDTDGTTSTALLMCLFHQELSISAHYHIPNRFTEGYGLNIDTIQQIADAGCDLLITVDCGITSVAEVVYANTLGIDVIVTDHHQPPPQEVPPAFALINPKMPDSLYPFDGLAGIGLAFKFAQAILIRQNKLDDSALPPFIISQLDLVALGTVVDMAPLVGENRTLTRIGLSVLNQRERPGIRALCQISNLDQDEELDGYALGFKLGPRINAAGRMDTAQKVIELMTTKSDETALLLAKNLDILNTERRQVQNQIEQQAIEQVEKKDLAKMKSLVVAHHEWHKGIIGIVASRIKDTYHRPVFLLAIDGDVASASGRGIDGINIADGLNACTDLLIKHGGHRAAAGFSIKTENIGKFEKRFNEFAQKHLTDSDLQPRLSVDFEVSLDEVSLDSLNQLKLLEPTGMQNDRLRVVTRNLKIKNQPKIVGQDKKHLSFSVTDGLRTIRAIAFGMAEYCIAMQGRNTRVNLAFSPDTNKWQGEVKPQLKVDGIQIEKAKRNDRLDIYPEKTEASPAKLIDRRNVRGGKANYMMKLLKNNQMSIFYVRDDSALDECFNLLQGHDNPQLKRCRSDTTESERQALIKMMKDGNICSILSSQTLSHLPAAVRNIIFCHPTKNLEQFYQRCQPAFSESLTISYLHLLYSSQDFDYAEQLLDQHHPERDLLVQLYRKLIDLAKKEQKPLVNNKNQIDLSRFLKSTSQLAIPPKTIAIALDIFEELEFISVLPSHSNTSIQLLPSSHRPLDESRTFRQERHFKNSARECFSFLKQGLEVIWSRLQHECRTANSID